MTDYPLASGGNLAGNRSGVKYIIPFVISYTRGVDAPFGVAWFDELGRDPRGGDAFRYFATRDECIAHVGHHVIRTSPVLLDEDEVAA